MKAMCRAAALNERWHHVLMCVSDYVGDADVAERTAAALSTSR
jgi:hypothetical protein